MSYRITTTFVLLAGLLLACSQGAQDLPGRASEPPVVGPFVQRAGFSSADATGGPTLGMAVAVDGDTALAGAPGRYGQPGATGSAEIYRRQAGGGWQAAGTLRPSQTGDAAGFGRAVALSGGTAAVAGEHTVRVYAATEDGWREQQVLFGEGGVTVQSVALAGTILAIGDSSGPAVHVFENPGGEGGWQLADTLTLADVGLEFAYHFGRDIDLSEDGGTLIVSNSGSSDQYYRHASAFIFERDAGPGGWVLSQTLRPPEEPGRDGWDDTTYGWTVAVDGDTAVVGSATVLGERASEVFVYQRAAGGWGEVARHSVDSFLQGETPQVEVEASGRTVAVDGDLFAVGAYGYTCYQAQSYDMACESGHVYVFEQGAGGGSEWGLVQTLRPDQAGLNQQFGRALAVSAGTVVVGARGGSSDTEQGVYIFER